MRRALPLFALLVALPAFGQYDRPAKKVVEYGWDVPLPDFVRQHIKEMERKPFDGLVFRTKDYNHAFDTRPWSAQEFQPQLDDLAAIEWGTFKDNFLTLYSANQWGMSWYDDAQWQTIVANLKLFAEACRRGRCVGVVFDPEPYGPNPWQYRGTLDDRPFAEVQAQVRRRGAQFLNALQGTLPELRLLLFYQMGLFQQFFALPDGAERAERLSQHGYALLPAFVNGMLDVAGPGVRVIDGNENSYYYTGETDYLRAYHTIRQGGLALVDPANRARYTAQVQCGMALYVDQVMALRAGKVLSHWMEPDDRPKFFEHNTYWALRSTDEYVWCYSEKMNWWTGQIPAGLEEALRSARDKVAAGKPLNIPIEDIVAAAKQRQSDELKAHLKQRSADIPRLQGATAPGIDGKLDEAAWGMIKPLDDLLPLASFVKDRADAPTQVKVTYDDQHLYVAFRCWEPKVAKLEYGGDQDDQDIWNGDCVELFLGTSDKPLPYRHFILNPKGIKWDGSGTADGDNVGWNADWRGAARVGESEWTAEMAIPWSALGGRPGPGTSRRANLCRQRRPVHELTAWSVMVSGFQEADLFGTWRF